MTLVVVAADEAYVVVAVPYTKSPPDGAPLPIVVEAIDMRPPLKLMSVEVDSPYEVVVKGQGAVKVSVPPKETVPPPVSPVPVVMVTELEVRRLVPMVVVEITLPVWSVARSAEASAVMARFVEVPVPYMVRPPVAVPLPIVEEA